MNRECIIGVGDGSGQLFVRGSYEAVRRVQSMIFELERFRAASVDTHAERCDVKQAQPARVGSAVPEGQTPQGSSSRTNSGQSS